jgi:S-adenosylmethionine:tRNA ribosyltransferase-isomerase
MRLDELDYELPPELIAQTPVEPRDASRLLVVSGRGAGLRLEDRRFSDLVSLLEPGDVLVRNDSRVFPARAFFRRTTGALIEVLFLEQLDDGGDGGEWEVLVRGKVREGEVLLSQVAGDAFRVELRRRFGDGRWALVCLGDESPSQLLAAYGETPLPPYIKQRLADPERYQTTYARDTGSAAAPTAGLHFTPALDAALVAAGIAIEHLTLHVGLGTFRPVTTDVVEDHPLHDEPFTVSADVWRRIDDAAAAGRRIVAVGTTMVRLLEHMARLPAGLVAAAPNGVLRGRSGLFITPGYEFAVVDGVLTNFHLPRTSLLALVMAFCGKDEALCGYRHAIAERYRFYSFGDAMLAWRETGNAR